MAIKVTGTTVINDSRDLENISNVSEFVKGVNFVDTPDLFIDGIPDSVESEPTLTTSEFLIFGGGSDTHASTDWEVVRTSDSTTVFSSIGDTTNLTSINVTPALNPLEEYLFRVRHNGTNLGTSEYREVIAVVQFSPSTLGESIGGGFYMGTICAADTCYYLIIAPNATGCACCQFKTTNTSTSTGLLDSFNDGYANTYSGIADPSFNTPAIRWAATRSIAGFSDWYMPAINELQVFYDSGAGAGAGDPLPSGEDFANGAYWSSTYDPSCAGYGTLAMNLFTSDNCYNPTINGYSRVRAVRRVPV